MTTVPRFKRTWAATSSAVLLMTLFGIAAQVNAAYQLTKSQAKHLAATATTSADHRKLAAYFKLQADRLDAEAKDHEEFAEQFRLNPNTLTGGKTGGNSKFRTFEHCAASGKSLREAAKATRELASEHEQMAKEATK